MQKEEPVSETSSDAHSSILVGRGSRKPFFA